MGGLGQGRERALWLSAAGLLLAIYVSLYPVRFVVDALRDREALGPAVAVLFGVLALAVVAWFVRRRPGWREWAVLALAAVAGIAALVATERPEERIHFLEYGAFGGLVFEALRERRARLGPGPLTGRPATGALVVTAAAGWGDEGIQALLPNRFYDLRDVWLNAAGGAMAILILMALGWARRRGAGDEPAQ